MNTKLRLQDKVQQVVLGLPKHKTTSFLVFTRQREAINRPIGEKVLDGGWLRNGKKQDARSHKQQLFLKT